MTLESSKTYGEIGAILMVIGPLVGFITGAIGLVGLIMVLVAFHELADHYEDQSIFKNVLYGMLVAIAGIAITAVVVIVAAFGLLSVLGFNLSNWMSWTALQNFNWQSFTNWSALVPYAFAIVGALIVLFVFVVISAIFLRRSLSTVADKSGVHMFATTGLLTLIGAVLTIVIMGIVLLWISLILLAVAFSRLKA